MSASAVFVHVISIFNIVLLLLLIVFLHRLPPILTGRCTVTMWRSVGSRAIPSRVLNVRMRRRSEEVVGILVSLSVSFHRWSDDTRFPAARGSERVV